MSERLFALVIDDYSETFQTLKRALKDLAVDTYSVHDLKHAEDLISQCKPQMIFTKSAGAEGSWMSVLRMAEMAETPVSVIVVGATEDTQLYLSVMDRGAFDFIAPPFEHEPLSFVVRSAAAHAMHHRELAAQMTAA